MKDKRIHHGTMSKSSSEQQFRKSDTITFAVLNFWNRTPSTTGSYGSLAAWLAGLADWQADKIQLIFKNFKIHFRSKISTFCFI